MKSGFLIVLFCLFGCANLHILKKPLLKFNLNGKINTLHVGRDKKEVIEPLKSEIKLMSSDSVLIAEIKTDDKGCFSQIVNIQKKWNPLIIEVKPVFNRRLDEYIVISDKEQIVGYFYICNDGKPYYQNIVLNSNDSIEIRLNCSISEVIRHTEH